jgi:hypothetical protein
MQVHTSRESHEKQPGRKPGLKRAETGLGRPAWADRPKPFQARFDAPFDLVASPAIYSPLAESHVKIHSSSTATRPRTRSRLDREGSTRGLHLLRGILHHDQCYNEQHYGVKSLFVLGVEGGYWVVITEPMFWIFCYHIYVHVDDALIILVGRCWRWISVNLEYLLYIGFDYDLQLTRH